MNYTQKLRMSVKTLENVNKLDGTVKLKVTANIVTFIHEYA